MDSQIESAYQAKKYEDEIYKKWEESGVFHPEIDPKKKPFVISLPPPNATGTLHLGHATMLAFQDIMIRYHRMKGDCALWLPGTDHAAIATQSVVEKQLQAQGISHPRKELGREKLIDEIKKFVGISQDTIRNQMRKMGASCDWQREKYTLDDDMNHAVNTLFGRMFNDEIIYRGGRIVNWDPVMKTTVADDELERVEEKAPFYTFKYGPFEIGTARPETKFGDKYVVMHPDDERYKEYKHGDQFDCEWLNGKITATVLKDKSVDPEFGTGVMTITPWHDATDFEIAQRHNLDTEQVIDFDGNLLEIAQEFAGMPIGEARPLIVQKLEKKGLLTKVDHDYVHNITVNYRGKGVIEPQIMKQWFIDVNKKVIDWKGKKQSIKEVLQDVIRSKMINIVPGKFEKIYFHWIDNLRDWCISRQIWWGHQIPVWYPATPEQVKELGKQKDISSYNYEVLGIGSDNKVTFGSEKPEDQAGSEWLRDPDTLDTWFSSALWTFATLGWPNKTPELEYFHPTNVLETGYDILFFWVARMILASTYALRSDDLPEEKCIPFKTVYLHGMIRDRNGKKMSKSNPETCIDPLDMIEQYGTDALRLSLVIGSAPGNDMRLYEEKIAGYRNFINKIWNASRFALMNIEDGDLQKEFNKNDVKSTADKWIVTKLQQLIKEVDDDLENHRFSDSGTKIYDFLWRELCDWYLEISKGEQKNPSVLIFVLKNTLKLLHPFVPFVTEKLWEFLSPESLLITESWPEYNEELIFETESTELELIQQIISEIRRLRAESKVEAAKQINAIIVATNQNQSIEDNRDIIMRLARVGELTITSKEEEMPDTKSSFIGKIAIHLPLKGLIDNEKEEKRLEKEILKISDFTQKLEAKLANPGFTSKAPEEVIKKEEKRLEEEKQKLEKLREQLEQIKAIS
jgi:valyl-tRNA synthetase